METLTFDIDKTNISLTSYTMRAPRITGHNTDYQCIFNWSEDWDGLTISAKFHNIGSDKTDEYILTSDTCMIPYSVMSYGDLEIGISGIDGNGLIKNTRPFLIPVDRDIGMYIADLIDDSNALSDSVVAQIAAFRTDINAIAAITDHAVTDVVIQTGVDSSGDPVLQCIGVTDHTLSLPLASDTVVGLVRGIANDDVDKENKIIVNEDGTMSVYSLNVNKLVQSPEDDMVIGDVRDLIDE